MKRFTPRKLSPRLDGFDYVGAYAYFLTTNTEGWQPVLRGGVAELCVLQLGRAARERCFEVIAYTFMPDHVHLLVAGANGTADLESFMKHFKQLTGYAYKQTAGQALWQRGFYDHVLRSDESIAPIAAYTWYNPVRAGIVVDIADYPFSGPRQSVEAHHAKPPSGDSVPPWLTGASFDTPRRLSLQQGSANVV